MLDLVRVAAGDKFISLLHHLQKCYTGGTLLTCSDIITYLVAFSATNMHIYHKVAIGHLMQAWARFALQCFSFEKRQPVASFPLVSAKNSSPCSYPCRLGSFSTSPHFSDMCLVNEPGTVVSGP